MALRATTHVRIACTLLLAAAGCTATDLGGERRVGADSVVVSLPERLGAPERPAVEFDHGKHAKAMEQKCEACHPEAKPGELSLKTVRFEAGDDRGRLMDAYHEQCRGCHAKRAKAKQSTGPVMCGDCHVKGSPVSPRRELAFVGKLHDTHVEATDKDCAVCHHHSAASDNPPPCKTCHDAANATKDQPALAEAVHRRCVGCHHKMGVEEGCSACHEKAAKDVSR